MQGIHPDYSEKLLTFFEADFSYFKGMAQAAPHLSKIGKQVLLEQLTPREQEVLQLVAAGRSNPEVATELFIALSTVKTHLKNIYGKLQVNNRVQAIARARDLHLL